MGMHDLGSWARRPAGTEDLWEGPRFLGGAFVVTLVVLGAGLLSLQVLDAPWFGVLLVFSAVILAYLMPFLWNRVLRHLWSAWPRA